MPAVQILEDGVEDLDHASEGNRDHAGERDLNVTASAGDAARLICWLIEAMWSGFGEWVMLAQ